MIHHERLREIRERHACDMDKWPVEVECTQHEEAPSPLTVGELRALLAMAQENDGLKNEVHELRRKLTTTKIWRDVIDRSGDDAREELADVKARLAELNEGHLDGRS